MSTVTKFTFDLDFDAPEEPTVPEAVEEEEEPEEIIPTFSEEEVEQARAEGFEAGKEEGRREAADATEQKLLEAIENACTQIGEIYSNQTDANRDIAREMVSVSTAIAKKMFPDLNARNALGEVERVVQETLKAVTEEPRIQIMVHSELREPLSERLGTMTHRAGFEGKVFVNPDPSMALGDCRIEWSNGAAVRDGEELWEMIDEIIEHNLHGPVDLNEEGADEAEAAQEPLQSDPDHQANEDTVPEDAPLEVAATDDMTPEDTPAQAAGDETADTDTAAITEDNEKVPAESETAKTAMDETAAVETAESAETEELTADETPSWQAAMGESTDAETAPMPEPVAEMTEEVSQTEDEADSVLPQVEHDEHSFTPSFGTDDDVSAEDNNKEEQVVSGPERPAPVPHIDDLGEVENGAGEDAGDEQASLTPVTDPDPVSPETQAAILDAQSALADDDDNDDNRNPAGG
ncbi:FliH/SctL family protein [Thalassospiraceae bacterium LMO-JJ14]|nr:FliH/SctL family protein [Thalassospiraceae bacterium LMO-JJ14]